MISFFSWNGESGLEEVGLVGGDDPAVPRAEINDGAILSGVVAHAGVADSKFQGSFARDGEGFPPGCQAAVVRIGGLELLAVLVCDLRS